MRPLFDINLVTYFLALGFLGLWFLFSQRRRWNALLGISFFISLLIHFIITVGWGFGPMKYFHFSKNLFLIGGFGFLFRLLKENKIALAIAVPASLIVSYQLFAINLTEKIIPEKIQKAAEYGELLILPQPDQISLLTGFVKEYKGYLVPAFHPKRKGTLLDEFFIIDIPDELRSRQEEILSELLENNYIRYGELNDRIQLDPSEKRAYPGREKAPALTNDPMVEDQWAFQTLHFDKIYQTLIRHQDRIVRPARVMVLDTGIDGDHEDLRAHISEGFRREKDPLGHGTHCAGIIGAETNNHLGISSMAFYSDLIELVPVRVLNSMGFGTQVQIINGMIKAVDEGADVLSMSLGGPSDHPRQEAYTAAVEYARRNNAVVIASAGNSRRPASEFSPANVQGVICVTATDPDDKPASFSNFLDPTVTRGIAAPGTGILSTYKGNTYKSMSGTSMAAPFVTSAAALLKAFQPDLKPEEIYDLLYTSARPLPEESNSGRLVQPHRALELLLDSREDIR